MYDSGIEDVSRPRFQIPGESPGGNNGGNSKQQHAHGSQVLIVDCRGVDQDVIVGKHFAGADGVPDALKNQQAKENICIRFFSVYMKHSPIKGE